jgi:hypothetical protein
LGSDFSRSVQRRGTHVNTPKIGSRDGELDFWGNLRIYAVLRRELFGGNLDLDFLGVLLVGPREAGEEGGRLLCFWGNFRCLIGVGRNFGEGAPLWGWDYLIREGRMTYDTMLWMGVTMR